MGELSAADHGDTDDVLARALAGSAHGEGSVIVVGGAAGTGKTTLLAGITARARAQGFTTLVTTASGVERPEPFGLLGRLLTGSGLPEDARATIWERLRQAGTGRVSPAAHKAVADVVIAHAWHTPVFIAVDDVDAGDGESLQFLLYLARRVARAPILVVVTESAGRRTLPPRLRAEVLSLSHCHKMRLRPLAAPAVGALLRQHLGAVPTDDLVAEHLRVTGGNPLLFNALLDDRRRAVDPPAAVVVGEAFDRAVLHCLHRSAPRMVKLVRALAVLDGSADLEVLAEIMGTDVWSARRALKDTEETGLAADGQFRHPRVRSAVLDTMLPEELVSMYVRTAAILHHHTSGSALAVARQLVAARRLVETLPAGESWRVPQLVAAARQVSDHDDARFALDCLRLADEWCAVEDDRLIIQLHLVRAHWRMDPAGGRALVQTLLDAARQGRLTGRPALELVFCLLWFGMVDDAVDLLARTVAASTTGDSPDTVMALYSTVAQLHYLYPGISKTAGGDASPPESITTSTLHRAYHEAVRVVESLLHGRPQQLLADAERILVLSPLDETTFGPVWVSLELLLLAERLDRAAFWCDNLMQSAQTMGASTWSAMFSAVRATISLGQGDPARSERDARRALELLPVDGWGVLVGIPVSALVAAYTQQGSLDAARALLGIAMPDAMFRTPAGLQYLRARGRYHLAAGDVRDATADFERCRDLSVRWGRDTPSTLPWRTDLAEARLAVGDRARARELAQEQLDRLSPDNRSSRGNSLLILAAADDPIRRPDLLRQAIALLQHTGDRPALARAYADLSEALHALGDETQARVAMRTSERIALTGEPAGIPTQRPYDLTDAEFRVATLAAQGRTNRQIAERLSVTVSTVEQHLTRVYRKVGVQGRSDLLRLPMDLRPDAGGDHE